MKIDLLHNKIVKDNITPAFVDSFMDALVPKLELKYGDSLLEVQMYEDYLGDDFVKNGEFYYPLTLIFDTSEKRKWIKWNISDKKRFTAGVPYAYIGRDPLDIQFADDVPASFENKLTGRASYFDGGCASFKIESASPDKTFLIGKYSQTFIDEMARQISREIENAFAVFGIAESSIELSLIFAPGTYMEHVVDGVTYRRLHITAKGCAPRDLWIKWTRVRGVGSLTVSDNVSADSVKFELGEDVPQKIREKEYRFLVHSSVDRYQSAMGRKNITEWRDLMKRAIKRGELVKRDVVTIDAEKSSELTFKLQEVLGFNPETPKVEVEKEEKDDLADILKGVLGVDESEETLAEEVEETSAEEVEAVVQNTAVAEEVSAEILPEPEIQIIEEEKSETVSVTADEKTSAVVSPAVTELPNEDELRKKIEAEIREKLELEVRIKAEAEAMYLRRAHDELKAENERLAEIARKAEADRLASEAERAAEAERLRFELESRERAEARERERMAEAARLALIEQQKIMEERAAEERRQAAEAERIRAEQVRAEQEARAQEAKRLEAERIRAEMEARAKEAARAEAAAKAAEAERLEAAAKAARIEAEKAAQPTYTYVSKEAKLLFKYPVDPNITKRIHEIILTTIKYFHKENVYIKIKASVPDTTTVNLQFVKIPEEENELLINIIKVLGKSDLGITKVYLE